jgi:hypothetical protein
MQATAGLGAYVTLTPDTTLPVQFHHRPAVSPEERLMLAIFEDALGCFQRGTRAEGVHRRRLFMEACDWIFCRDRYWPFSFENICETFGIDPGYVRCALAQWVRCALAPVESQDSALRAAHRMEEALACMQMRDRG